MKKNEDFIDKYKDLVAKRKDKSNGDMYEMIESEKGKEEKMEIEKIIQEPKEELKTKLTIKKIDNDLDNDLLDDSSPIIFQKDEEDSDYSDNFPTDSQLTSRSDKKLTESDFTCIKILFIIIKLFFF